MLTNLLIYGYWFRFTYRTLTTAQSSSFGVSATHSSACLISFRRIDENFIFWLVNTRTCSNIHDGRVNSLIAHESHSLFDLNWHRFRLSYRLIETNTNCLQFTHFVNAEWHSLISNKVSFPADFIHFTSSHAPPNIHRSRSRTHL